MFAQAAAYFRRDVLLLVVFVTGLAVLAVEILAVRMLAPYFGNTVYSFSSVISVILAALAIGYWHGGRLADRRPSIRLFYGIVTACGVSVLLVHLVSPLVLTFLAGILPLTYGPLVAAIVLFLVPSVLFGLLSPFVIKLRTEQLPERGAGTISGEVFFASTVGSIGGSLLSGFYLIPHIGLNISMIAIGVLVAVVGVAGLVRSHSYMASMNGLLLMVLLVAGPMLMHQSYGTGTESAAYDVLYSTDGLYERVTVLEGEHRGTLSRILLLDRSFSSGISLEGELVFPYTRYYELYNLFAQRLNRALVLGAGTGTVAKKLLEDHDTATVDMVDVEPTLFALARDYFFLPENERLHEYVQDGRQFLRRSDASYDLIFADMYSSLYAVPWHVATQEFYVLVYNHLSPGGVYMGNYVAANDGSDPSLLGSTIATIESVFGDAAVFAVERIDKAEAQNYIILAQKGTRKLVVHPSDLIKHENGSLLSYVDNLVPPGMYPRGVHRVFTDDRTNIDLLSANMAHYAD
jgi:spermidine synthase